MVRPSGGRWAASLSQSVAFRHVCVGIVGSCYIALFSNGIFKQFPTTKEGIRRLRLLHLGETGKRTEPELNMHTVRLD